GPTAPAPISQLMGELVIDLLETTGLIPEAKFAILREKAKHFSVVQVLIDEGLASSEAIARIVAAQHGLPVIELGSIGIDPIAASSVPLHVLEQVNAIPYAYDGDSLCVAISDAPLVRLVNSIIFEAAEDGASDVHFEPQADSLVVRFRIDGVLHETQRIPKRSAIGVTTRLKVLAKLDIAERRKPQDGRISL